jgi:hypothetical protein
MQMSKFVCKEQQEFSKAKEFLIFEKFGFFFADTA